jgi:hypothetical protein
MEENESRKALELFTELEFSNEMKRSTMHNNFNSIRTHVTISSY